MYTMDRRLWWSGKRIFITYYYLIVGGARNDVVLQLTIMQRMRSIKYIKYTTLQSSRTSTRNP